MLQLIIRITLTFVNKLERLFTNPKTLQVKNLKDSIFNSKNYNMSKCLTYAVPKPNTPAYFSKMLTINDGSTSKRKTQCLIDLFCAIILKICLAQEKVSKTF